jgi:hypothetical protein
VLHVATGYPRLMIATIETCEGPRAYTGAVFGYHERREPGFAHLTDAEWLARLEAGEAVEVEWMAPVLAR